MLARSRRGPALLPVAILALLTFYASACGGDGSDEPTPLVPVSVPTPTHGGPVVIVSARENLFDKTSLTGEANEDFSIVFVNNDAAPHNVAVYTNDRAEEEIYVGETFTGPGEYREYTFRAPRKGTYFFRCDVHPTVMTGEFVVE